MPVTESFSKADRLRNRSDFLRVQERGAKLSAGPLLLLSLPNSTSSTRVGLTVSGRVGNAVVRNRIRRHLREWYRKHRALLPKGLDLVVIARNSAAQADGPALARALESLVRKLAVP